MGKRRPAKPLPSTLIETLHGASVQAELDLHGLSVEEALHRVQTFLSAWEQRQPGAVLRIITGKGNRSSGAPVLPEAVRELLRDQMGGQVTDFVGDRGGGGWLVRVGRGAR